MTDLLDAAPHSTTASPRPRQLPATAAFYLQASIVLFFLAGSSVLTPLYGIYQAEWGFSPVTTTVVFGVYAVAVLAALLVVGSLSDHVGRRPVLLVAIAVQVATMLVFTAAGGVTQLLVARVLQGLSTGAAVGAVGAGMLDLDRRRGTVANSVAPMLGTASGGLLSGLLVQYLPAPTRLVYLLLLGIFVLQFVGVTFMRESADRRPGAVQSLKLQFGLPRAARRPLLVAAPVLIAGWAIAGFYGSLGPALVRTITHSGSHVLGGLALFVLAGSGALTVLALHNVRARTSMLIGVTALGVGVGGTLVAMSTLSAPLFFAVAAVAGAGFGAGFQGAIRTVLPLAAAHERAGVLSIVYVVSYLALGLPAIVAGYVVVHGNGLLTTAREYSAAAIVLAAVAIVGLLRTRPGSEASRSAQSV